MRCLHCIYLKADELTQFYAARDVLIFTLPFLPPFCAFVDKYMRRTTMGFEQRKQERQALVQHLLAQDWDVFGTLKFVNGRTIGRHSANKLLRSYWNKDGSRDLRQSR